MFSQQRLGGIRVIGLCLALLGAGRPVSAQSCGDLKDSHQYSQRDLDFNGDGFPDLRVLTEQGRRVKYNESIQSCVIDEFKSVMLVPLGGAQVASVFTDERFQAARLVAGSRLGPSASEDWSSAPLTGYLYTRVGPLPIAFEKTLGPLDPAKGASGYIGLRIPGPEGPFFAWVQMASGPDGTVVDWAAQGEPSKELVVGSIPPPPGGDNFSTSRSVDTNGDGVVDLFVVRATRTDPVSGEQEVRVSLKDLESGEILVGPGESSWPAGEYAVGLRNRQLLRDSAEAPARWRPMATAGSLWVRVRRGGVWGEAWGPLASGGGKAIGVRRPGGILSLLSFSDQGELLASDWTPKGALAVGTRHLFVNPSHVVDRTHLDMDRDGLMDFVAIRLSYADDTPGAETSVQNRIVLHALGPNRLGTEFVEAREFAVADTGLPPGSTVTNVVLRDVGIWYQKPLPNHFDVAVPKDRYLPFYLETQGGWRVGWLRVDATAEPLVWRMGISSDPGRSVLAGDQEMGSGLSLRRWKQGGVWVVSLQWSEFLGPLRLQYVNQLPERFQNMAFGTATENLALDRADGWVDRSVTFPATPVMRFYRMVR